MNNHRQRLSQMCDLFLYQHFCSDGHSEDDIAIMPIEEVTLEEGECMNLASKRLQREEYWYRELASIYPYGRNDNVRRVGNISKKGNDDTIVWTLFNKNPRKFKRRSLRCSRRHRTTTKDVETTLRNLIRNHHRPGLVHELWTLVFGILQHKLGILIGLANTLLLERSIPIISIFPL